jgi:UDP-glucose 4-epimerase
LRILLTGATGFVGSCVLRRLLEGGHDVAVLVRPGAAFWRIEDVMDRAERIEGDLTDLPAAEPAIAGFGPESVVHLAWAGVGNSHRNDPAQADNIPVALELLHLARRVGASRWVGVGSQAEYGPREGPTREDAPTRPTTLYGVAKLCTCLLAERLCAEFGLRFAWLRLFSSYGPGDDPAWMIPYLIRRLLAGERPALTAGAQRWDYIYVTDAADAVARAAVHADASGVYNLGTGEARPLRSIVEAIRDRIDPSLPLGFGEVPYRPDQVMHLEADVGRLRDGLGWSPRVTLDEGLTRTVAWYRNQWAAAAAAG